MVSVRLVDLTKRFGRVVAVDHLNLEVAHGEFVALLGPSGCGKTTTLLMIAGIYRPTEGYIYFDDRVVNDLEPKDRNVGMVFQTYALYPHMKVFDNIAFPLKLKKVPKEEIERKVRRVAELLHIEDLLDRKPSQLSGGQQQRVALARALVKEPDLFLMDEPLSNLDAKLRVEMRGELKRLQKDLGITTIYVTHDQLEAMTMADRIAVLNNGRLQQYGPPEELYRKPANKFGAG
ncbi:MAG: ABC transporter ATP-binding protein, partial [Candidatus Korarchaeota archaeon]|nr:ABC transporter ATP-binding protein [Candidatus Korarchaeota archaeon]